MRLPSAAAVLASSSLVNAYSSQFELHNKAPKKNLQAGRETYTPPPAGLGDSFVNSKTQKYAVNGSTLPLVDFDVGDSFAGQMSISDNPDDENALFFWFFPSSNANASDEITIWLNGGPGCSSLDGFLQENGPFLWQSGTYRPLPNQYGWNKLTNMVWIDQPVGTGLSTAAPGAAKKIVNEEITAKQFMGFWKNFMTTFNLKGRKVYLTGESYAGMYVPYIAYYMLMANNTDYYNVKGIQINDPSIGYSEVLTEAPAVWHMQQYQNIFNLASSTYDELNELNIQCGYDKFMRDALTYPPLPKYPDKPKMGNDCFLWDSIVEAASVINPCFNVYHLTDFCPFLWDVMGFPSEAQTPYLYFNRTDVQKALNIPQPIDYSACGDPGLGLDNDQSVPSAFLPLPYVIEHTKNVNIGSGSLDYLLLTNGTLATIQNMTWNGARGFHTRPSDPFFVPAASRNYMGFPSMGGSGYLGITHKERGLTWFETFNSGHEIPQYVPGAAFRQLEYLLGRVKNVTAMTPFTVNL